VITVIAGIIELDGKILIAQRKAEDDLAYKWEFPGGKLEADETPEQCIVRELREELGIQTRCGSLVGTSIWSYRGVALELHAYRVHYLSGSFILHDHAAIQWVAPEELDTYDFAEADLPLVQRLKDSPREPLI
jgi:8-oxo-dGTP diphosphatase